MNSHTIITVECTSMQIANHPQTVNSLQDYVLCAGKATGFALGLYVTTGILEYSDSVMPTIWTFHHTHLLVDNGASRPADFLLHLR